MDGLHFSKKCEPLSFNSCVTKKQGNHTVRPGQGEHDADNSLHVLSSVVVVRSGDFYAHSSLDECWSDCDGCHGVVLLPWGFVTWRNPPDFLVQQVRE